MLFSDFLNENIITKKYTRKELIAKLNLFHEQFKHLDSVTLSRWIKNKTTPSIYKQVLIAYYFHVDILNFIFHVVHSNYKTSKELKRNYNILMNEIESSYTNITYDNGYFNYSIKELFYDEYIMKFGPFYKKFKLYSDLLKTNNELYLCVMKKNKHVILSHITAVKLNLNISNNLSHIFKIEVKGDYFVDLCYFDGRESYTTLFSLMLYIFYRKKIRKIILLSSQHFLNFDLNLACEKIGAPYTDNHRKIYLLKVDLLQVLSEPFVINLLYKNKPVIDELLKETDKILSP